MLEALAQTPGEFARRVCGVSETDTVAVVPRGVKEIPDYGFYGLSSLRRVELPEGVEKIGRSAFAWCDSLREVRLPKSLTDIGAHAFAYCERMERADLPPRLRHIGNNAFSRCLALRSAEVPASVTELESYAFSDCVSLRRATLPANKSLLGELIFSGCLNLRELRCMSPVPPPPSTARVSYSSRTRRRFTGGVCWLCRRRGPRHTVMPTAGACSETSVRSLDTVLPSATTPYPDAVLRYPIQKGGVHVSEPRLPSVYVTELIIPLAL